MEDLKVIPPQTVQTQVTNFKETVKSKLSEFKTDKIEIEVEEIKRYFRFENENEDTKYWLPARFRNEMKVQGIRIHKRRGYTTVFVEIVKPKSK
jgi:Rieske Fe-S protein